MLIAPAVGQRVRLHYNPKDASKMPHHGKAGAVVISGRGKPRNHLVRLDNGPLIVVPCGNIYKATATQDAVC
ncbi:MAG: hypothetical protein KKE73_03830 [Proteobacteria bacterium]|nr:hypothetical protein [Pseudomonadota bacterium]